MRNQSYSRIVLKPQASLGDVSTTGNHVDVWTQVASSRFWIDEPYTEQWKSIAGNCTITFILDPLREVRYYHLTGTDLKRYAAIIRARIATYRSDEVTALFCEAETAADRINAIYHVAASAPADPDPTIIDFLTHALTYSNPTVRRAAVDANLLALWPAMREPLEQVAREDPEAELRLFATETLNRLSTQVWDVEPGAFDFTPLPPDRRRITPLTGVGDRWYEAAYGERQPKRRAPGATEPLPSRKPEFRAPLWLTRLMKAGDFGEIRWHTAEQIRIAAGQYTEWKKPSLVLLSDAAEDREKLLWEAMVALGEGPEFTDRCGRKERSLLFLNRDAPKGLLLALGPDHLPSLWVPAGRTRRDIDAAVTAYLFPGLPPQAELPFQGRLFLATLADFSRGFVEVERLVERSPFTDMLPWGSIHSSDPYPAQVTLGQIPVNELRRYMGQDPTNLPRTSIRTRYSRSIIQLVDWRNGYFADLYFHPASPVAWAEKHNDVMGTDFPPGTPVDVVGALHGLACIGADRIRLQIDDADDEDQRRGMEEIVGFMEQVHEGYD